LDRGEECSIWFIWGWLLQLFEAPWILRRWVAAQLAPSRVMAVSWGRKPWRQKRAVPPKFSTSFQLVFQKMFRLAVPLWVVEAFLVM
jgi:hypothetical protein